MKPDIARQRSGASLRRPLCTAVASLMLAGCASLSPEGGFGEVRQLTQERTGQAPAFPRTPEDADVVRSRVEELQKSPLSADGAVELALLNHRGLQASFAELGVSDADRVQAGRLRGPSLGFGRLAGGGIVEIDRSIVFDLLGLITMPTSTRIEQARFEQTQLRAASEAVRVAAEARRAFYGAVAAKELASYAGQVKEAAEASGELARRMLQAGNFSKLQQMREQAFQDDATLQLARARHQAVAERERLARVLGLSGDPPPFQLPDRLPELPAAPVEPGNAEQTAMDQRLDVRMARRSAESVAQSLGLTRSTRWIDVLDAGYQNKSQTGEPRQDGYEVRLVLPLFDFGSARVARAEASYMQSVHRAAQVANDARSEVRESYSAYRTAYELARHYRDEVVPLRKRISDENLLRYNGMLISVFDLLADARDQIASVNGYVEALRDHWIAQTRLQTALTGGSPGEAGSPPRAASAAPAAGAH